MTSFMAAATMLIALNNLNHPADMGVIGLIIMLAASILLLAAIIWVLVKR